MHCNVRFSLLSQYLSLMDEYQFAVDRLKKNGAPLVQSEFLLLWTFANRAAITCTNAQRKIEAHIRDHHCMGYPKRALIRGTHAF
jgi:hypothetical protein